MAEPERIEIKHPDAVGFARYVDPGPLVIRDAAPFKFQPLETTLGRRTWGPKKRVYSMWLCPHGNHECEERFYPELDPPAFFVDCSYCRITWEMEIGDDRG